MQIIVKCPGCGHRTLGKIETDTSSDFVANDVKKCGSCGITLRIHVHIKVTQEKAETVKK